MLSVQSKDCAALTDRITKHFLVRDALIPLPGFISGQDIMAQAAQGFHHG